ncbi:saccharopine dehydrogenase C-terminal domain-containing protein [Frigidibacter oleivorans]|uniref:saccharopine dehydrogenase C-terminal domain-containing protein n=1 Tax=Frigidibacter oleivorans TaxID=2487129 RepID=UPI001F191C36|nr:saccharopine dehydrogenase C-terminal domain-containing protein [Frigidibacter oleivorans]
MARIHWCGAGLSSGPGLRRLIAAGHPVTVWDLNPAAAAGVAGAGAEIRQADPAALAAALAPGDVLVSMVPADGHPALARLAVEAGAHFVCSSYLSPAMRALDGPARRAGVALVNEVGLDPGLDHLMAHDLVAAYRASPAHDPENVLSFTSVCGGFPRHPNAFRYKFSWSPLAVLKALQSPARCIRAFSELTVDRPWQAVSRFDAPLIPPETFEVYPNRDSLPFLADYGFDPGWTVRDFQRGTLRLLGWAEAWQPVFVALEGGDAAELAALADRLGRENAYAPDEPDRVVLAVALKAESDGRAVFHRGWALDATGDARGSAMARLVSGTVALAVESVLARELPAGVQAAPRDPRLIARWLEATRETAQFLHRADWANRS